MERSRIHQVLLLGAALGSPGVLARLKDEDFEPDIRAVIQSLRARLAKDGEQRAGRTWAATLHLDWDKLLVEQLIGYVAADAEREKVDGVLWQMQVARTRKNSVAYQEMYRKLAAKLPEVRDADDRVGKEGVAAGVPEKLADMPVRAGPGGEDRSRPALQEGS